jgi:predicted ATP-grasp superfamily ATP-dependent carboligase
MGQTVLLTIGRLPKALDFARSFHGAGWRVLVAEPFKTHLTGASRSVARSFVVPPPSHGKQAYLIALAKIIADENVDLVLPLSEESLHVAHLRPLLLPKVQIYAPPPETILQLHDKAAFIALAQSHGLAVPDTAILGSDEAEKLATRCDYVIKPVFSCSGRGVSLHKAGESLRAAITDDPNQKAIVQQKLTGHQFSSFSIADKGQLKVTTIYRGTLMSGSVAVGFERVDLAAITKWVTDFVAAIHYSGVISFDFFVDSEGKAWAIECNPRVTSGVHFIETQDLAPAILSRVGPPPRLRSTTKMMQFYPAFMEVQDSFLSPKFFANVQGLLASQDVTWSISDPMPFITMPITSFTIIMRSILQKESFGEVSTADISWFEGAALGSSSD